MKYIFVFFLNLILIVSVNAQVFQWAKTGTPSYCNFIINDKVGNLYGANNTWVAKYDNNGNLQWQQDIAGVFTKGIVVDTIGNLYVTGVFGYTAYIGTDTLVANAGGDANTFLAKYDSMGSVQWVKRSYSNEDSHVDAITIDKQGNPIIVGRFIDSLQLDSFIFDAPLTNQLFLAKYSSSGVCLWAKHLESWSFQGGAGGPKMKTDKWGNSYISGHFTNHATFDSITTYSHGAYDWDIFLTKFDINGNFLWAKTLGGNDQEIYYTMDVDSFGNSYVTGYFSSATAYFGNLTLTTPTNDNFTCKYDSGGTCQWVKYGGLGSICAVNDGFYGDDPGFITKYDTLGATQWSKNVNGAAYNYAMTAADNAVYIAGTDSGSVYFDTCNVNSANWQMYIAKLGVPVSTVGITESENNSLFTVFPNPANEIMTVKYTSSNKNAATIRITNALGQQVYTEALKEISYPFSKQIEMGALPKGIYFVEFLQGDTCFAKKIILH